MVRKYGVFSAAVFAVVVSAFVGGLLGRNALATSADVQDYRVFTAALGAVEANYIDTVDSKRLVYSAIGGMLQTLDPHSSFMDPDYYKRMRERQEGHYLGLGITIQVSTATSTSCRSSRGHRPTRRGSAAATSSCGSAART